MIKDSTVVAGFLLSVSLAAAALSSSATAAGLADKFANPAQTIEYHFMLDVPGLKEQERDKDFAARVAEPLRALGEISALGKPKSGVYVDSKDLALDKRNLIVRVREGQITIKARALGPDKLLDLSDCGAKKYEMDYFGEPNYSISSDIVFKPVEFATVPPALTVEGLWRFMQAKCPALFTQIEPYTASALRIPGVATMYTAEIKLRHPAAAKVKEASMAIWFFPPTGRSLVEFAYTGYVKDKADMEALYAHALSVVKAAGLYKQDQSSKTLQYLRAYLAED
jgi:hypothetical protein